MTTSHNNPTRAWSRNTIHPLFPLDSLGAGIIIGAGPGGRCSLRAPRRHSKRGGRREARAANTAARGRNRHREVDGGGVWGPEPCT